MFPSAVGGVGNLESDLQAGAYCGYQLLWVLLVATVLGLFMQVLALRLGVVTGRHLAQMCRQEYPRRLRLMVWLMIECAIIGSDIQEVLGSALAFQILFGLPLWAGVLVTAADTMTFLFLHALGIRKLEAFFAALIAVMTTCFFIDFGYVRPSAVGIAEVAPQLTLKPLPPRTELHRWHSVTDCCSDASP